MPGYCGAAGVTRALSALRKSTVFIVDDVGHAIPFVNSCPQLDEPTQAAFGPPTHATVFFLTSGKAASTSRMLSSLLGKSPNV